MALIGVTTSDGSGASRYVASLESRGARTRVLTPERFTSLREAMDGVSGLLLTGGGDVSPALYGETSEPGGAQGIEPERDEMEMALFRYAIEEEMPTLGICRGMQLVNVAMGGRLIQDLPGHTLPEFKSAIHQVYVSPGSRLGAIIGAGAIYRTNSRHHQGLKEAQRAPSLMASAYHPEDGIVEALESPEHPWLVAVQCHPEREDEVPKSFGKLFEWLAGWAERYEVGDMPR